METREAEAADRRGSDGRWALSLAALFLAYVAVVHWPNPIVGIVRVLILLSIPNRPGSLGPDPGVIDIAAGYLYIGLPALLLFSALVTKRGRAQARLALAAQISAGTAIFIALPDLLVGPFLAGPGGYVLLMIVVSVLCWHLLVFAWARQVRRSSQRPHLITLLPGAAIVALMAWSLFGAVSVVLQSQQIARGRAYCIARTEDSFFGLGNFDYAPLRTLEGLRGTRLFTTSTGYKIRSRWWFHAVLIVDGEEGRQYWNWSISRIRFEPFYDPDRFVERPTHVCQPALSFLAHRPWLRL